MQTDLPVRYVACIVLYSIQIWLATEFAYLSITATYILRAKIRIERMKNDNEKRNNNWVCLMFVGISNLIDHFFFFWFCFHEDDNNK